ncbi:PIG-L family deacetylase [Salipiger sp. IMCC34102]|uniref:PIG-L deacetylase family protein n=1 Tax=Salipiger sp. IMCC34102 TaxID=2510647 RepID=UPI00101B66CB|nr:PIG-L deacetylase family protein [Salipiger sp. IMCC34102]RYH01347.1 PIG-L family deacetylase [Salipiger sp. IMCC34102]
MNAGSTDLLLAETPLLVLAPHPDDESLGCGLLLAERWQRGLPSHVACLTDGAASHPASQEWPGPRLSKLRREELSKAVGCLGGDPARDITWFGYPDAALHRLRAPKEDLARDLGALIDRLNASTVVTASSDDPHCDHVACAAAARQAVAERPGVSLWSYAIWSRWNGWAEGREAPGARLDLPERRDAKNAAVRAHGSQLGQVVRDDPQGFAMPPGFAARFCAEPEIYKRVQP